jgi:50S ribosomal protein L16 3-hydroxylase
MRILGGLTTRQFLARHWQKRPLLVRRAFSNFRDPVTSDELAGLACEPEVESRLVLERGGRRPWQVIPGPQSARRLRALPPTHWTLLVQEVNKHVPRVAALLDSFDFLPHWRVDDVMISVAPRYGTVGPHVDSYDVFLIQGRGRRRWRIDTRASAEFRPGLDLRILKRFRPEAEWILEPGDMLYLPPGVAHHGVALEECLTYSVGFRAPRRSDLLLACLRGAVDASAGERHYADPGLALQRHPGEITPAALARMRAVVEQESQRALRGSFARVMGELLTEPKDVASPKRVRRTSSAQIARRLRAGRALVRVESSRLAFVRQPAGALLFVGGNTHELNAALAFAAPLLTDRRWIPFETLRPHLGNRRFIALVTELVNQGALDLATRVGTDQGSA